MSKYGKDREAFLRVFEKAKENSVIIICASEDVEKVKILVKDVKVVGFDNLNGNKYGYNRVHNEKGNAILSAFRDVLRRICLLSLNVATAKGFVAKYDGYTPLLAQNILAYQCVKMKQKEEASETVANEKLEIASEIAESFSNLEK